MKKLQHIIMVALILIGLVTPALAQEQTDDLLGTLRKISQIIHST